MRSFILGSNGPAQNLHTGISIDDPHVGRNGVGGGGFIMLRLDQGEREAISLAAPEDTSSLWFFSWTVRHHHGRKQMAED